MAGCGSAQLDERRQVLIDASGIDPAAEPVSEGDLARQTLLLLAEAPGPARPWKRGSTVRP